MGCGVLRTINHLPFMKLLLIIIVLFSLEGYSQDTIKIKKIDSLVNLINRSNLKVHRDTVNGDNPAIGLSTQTYVTTIKKGTELKKYVTNTFSKMQYNGKTVQSVSLMTYYYDRNKVIKVEQYIKTGNVIQDTKWYYEDDKAISTPSILNAQLLAQNILWSGKEILKTVSE